MVALLAAMLMSLGLFSPPAVAADRQWYLDAMSIPEVWKVAKGEGVTVAVIDSGVKPVPGLEDRLLPGKSFTSDDPDAHEDVTGHGTEMATLIAGTGTANSLQGLAPKAKILPVRTHVETDFITSWDKTLVNAIRYAARSDAKVINISQGLETLDYETLLEMQDAINEANERGKIIFAASGNAGRHVEKSEYPSVLPGVVTVGAVGEDGKVADFSNYGPHLALSAPGDPGGTSQAAAVASATAALIWSEHPDWTNHQVLRVMIETTGRSMRGEKPSMYLGHGIVRPAQVLVDGDGDPGPADKSPLFSKHFASLEASKSPSPEADDGTDAEDAKNRDDSSADSGGEQTAASEESGGSGTPWLAIGIGAAALVVVAATAGVITVRRRA
ncbi:S8 family serine peptidase [Streptomyces sp. TRM 70361]|uniref:S8 family serine peptidase n=1 Tax=Streptomyces sp. TRM 70361 TaxID=3116553 RepID=UPI002E7B1B4F|nr:S8 family serine peptidase [Streptomyces sp. TRM 70361]MEE1942336.1 S8 family serine peptidase [Streptomyces sp. TRM 70361]